MSPTTGVMMKSYEQRDLGSTVHLGV